MQTKRFPPRLLLAALRRKSFAWDSNATWPSAAGGLAVVSWNMQEREKFCFVSVVDYHDGRNGIGCRQSRSRDKANGFGRPSSPKSLQAKSFRLHARSMSGSAKISHMVRGHMSQHRGPICPFTKFYPPRIGLRDQRGEATGSMSAAAAMCIFPRIAHPYLPLSFLRRFHCR